MQNGRVASIHIHPRKPSEDMVAMDQIDVVADKGIVQDRRYYGRQSSSGLPSQRQMTLIEREQIAEHATALECSTLPPGVVRSNIETEGISWRTLAGKTIRIGTAKILIGLPRDPCAKMDAIQPGLRDLMEDGRQGVLAQIVESGTIRVGDEIREISTQPRIDNPY